MTLSASFIAAIAGDMVKIAEIYDFDLVDGTTVRLTTHGGDITWNVAGDVYSTFPMQRESISRNSDGEFDEFRLLLANMGGTFEEMVHKGGFESARITVRRIRWDTEYAADEEQYVFVGTPDVSWNKNQINITNRSILASLNILVPRHTFQESCNHIVFDSTCGLIKANHAYSSTATGGSTITLVDSVLDTLYTVAFDNGDSDNAIATGDTVTGGTGSGTGVIVHIIYTTSSAGFLWYAEQGGVQFVNGEELDSGGNTVDVDGTPVEDTTFWEVGELEMTSGDNSGYRRAIYSSSGGTITVFVPFINAIASGDDYSLFPGCIGTGVVCRDRFNNLPPWRGYAYVPRSKDSLYGDKLGYGF
ncbi:DUF2163 domain-containing protein [Candidatus Pacearchaeota archaeon]|nr:DUF2163 domain-containing protein [Candidatus Pacearchaeota archaeon]